MWRFFLSPGGICLMIGIFLIIAGIVLRIRETIASLWRRCSLDKP